MEAQLEAKPVREIPFGRPVVGDAERRAVARVLEGPILTHGPVVRDFEAAFAAFCGAPHAVATSTCTASLHLAYMALAERGGLEPGDEVIVPALSHVATAHAVELAGGRCVFYDADPRTGNLDPARLEALLTPRTRAISVVHFLGLPVDMVPVLELARRHGLFVVEDCALAVGARLDGVHMGLHGDLGCFSFYPVKHITTGEGGMTILRNDGLADLTQRLRAFGIDRNIVSERPRPGDYDVLQLGNNYRMSEMSAALGVEQMKRIDAFLDRRRFNDAWLRDRLADIDELRALAPGDERREHACYALVVGCTGRLAGRRDELVDGLKAAGIGTSVYYPRPIPLMTWYRERYGHRAGAFPGAESISDGSIALPVGPHLSEGDLADMETGIRRVLAGML